MDSTEILRQALQAARKGHELTARDLFQDVVRLDPNNEVAWMWLSGLLDPLEDRIEACERVLSINPANLQVQVYYEKLLDERKGVHQERVNELDEKVLEIHQFIGSGRRNEAMLLVQRILREESGHKEAWQLYAELSNNIHDKVRAYEAILKIDPADATAQEIFKRYRYFQRHPLELASHYEEEGELDKAIELYEVLATEAGSSPEFERLYKNIVRLEDARVENVRRVKPGFTILRLSLGLPLLYIVEVFIQEGLNPVVHPAPMLWLGIPLVALGSFLLTVASVQVRHEIWRRWFGDLAGRGSIVMRAIVGSTGLLLVLTPHLLLILDSYQRLRAFQIPAIPWIR